MNGHPLPPKQTLLLILLPLLGTFACERLYLHLVRVQHVHVGGYLVHHLFFGVLLVIPAAFLLAFGIRRRRAAIPTLIALGIGSAMILDEFVYLVVTKATDEDYVSRTSFLGATVSIALATLMLGMIYLSRRE